MSRKVVQLQSITRRMKKRRAPWKTGLIAFALAVLIGGIVMGVMAAMRPHDGRSPFEQGEAAGNAFAGVAIAIGIIAYVIAAKRAKDDDHDPV